MTEESQVDRIEKIAHISRDAVRTSKGIRLAGTAIPLFAGVPISKSTMYLAAGYCRRMAKSLPRHLLRDMKEWQQAAEAIEHEVSINGAHYS